MTWQDLATAILQLTPQELQLPALVFPPEGCPHDAAVPIIALVSPETPPFGLKPNVPMISTGKPPHS